MQPAYNLSGMRVTATEMRKRADDLANLADAIEASPNLPTETAKSILNTTGFRVIHADDAHDLLSLVRWAMTQDAGTPDDDTLARLEKGLINS